MEHPHPCLFRWIRTSWIVEFLPLCLLSPLVPLPSLVSVPVAAVTRFPLPSPSPTSLPPFCHRPLRPARPYHVTFLPLPCFTPPGHRPPRSRSRAPASTSLVSSQSPLPGLTRNFRPVPSCPDHAPPSRGWATFHTMRPHIDAHLAGQLMRDVPLDSLRNQGVSTCELCQCALPLLLPHFATLGAGV